MRKVTGLKIAQNERFLRYFELVQAKALTFNAVFFTGWTAGWKDGTRAVGDVDAAQLRGWLIPLSKKAAFEALWESCDPTKPAELPEWDSYSRYVKWTSEGEKLNIEFWYHFFTPEQKQRRAACRCAILDGPPMTEAEFKLCFFGLLPEESLDDIRRKQELPLE